MGVLGKYAPFDHAGKLYAILPRNRAVPFYTPT
jgi:hypothetical protein